METQSNINFMQYNRGDCNYTTTNPTTPDSCRFSSLQNNFWDIPNYNRNVDNDVQSYEFSNVFGLGMQYNSQYLWNDSETNSGNENKMASPFCAYDSPNTYSNSSFLNTNVTSNAMNRNTCSSINTLTTHGVFSPEASQEHQIHTTPVSSSCNPGESQPPTRSTLLMPYSESLKKKDFDFNKQSWNTKKMQTRKGAKRNLKYLSAMSREQWYKKSDKSSPGVLDAYKYDLQNKSHSQNWQVEYPGCRNDLQYSSLNHSKNNHNSVLYTGSVDSNDQESCSDRRVNNKLYVSGASLDTMHTLQHPKAHNGKSSDPANTHEELNVISSSFLVKDSSQNDKLSECNKTNQEVDCNYEIEGIPVGLPVRFTDHLDPLPDTLDSKSLKLSELRKLVCCRCVFEISEDKNKSLTKSTEKSSHEKTSEKDENTQPSLDYVDNNKKEDKVDTMNRKPRCSRKDQSRPNKKRKGDDKDVNICPSDVDLTGTEVSDWMTLFIKVDEVTGQGSHLCFGCQKPVFDRYVIQVKDHGFWHAECLKCSNCHDNLSGQKSCYVKNEQVFCRNDYNILFGLSCVKCSLQFKREQDWMRVAGQHRYHIACFLCKICKRQLGNNEKYHLVNGTDIYCTNHYRDMVNGESSDGQQPPKKAKRNRTSYTEAQIKFLQDRFLRDSNPDGNELEKIATHINLKKRVVQVWFQNNRARLKKSANNTKGGNQENKNPSIPGGVSGTGGINDAMCIDWDNSMEQSSLDEHTYPNSTSPSQLRPGSAHFMDASSYDPSSSLGGPPLCLQTGGGLSGALSQEAGSLGDGSASGASTCGTPRDQISPHFSDMANQAYQGADNGGVASLAGNENTGDDLPGADGNSYSGGISNKSSACISKDDSSSNVILSAIRTSVMRDKFGSCQRRAQTREEQEQEIRHHMMVFQDQTQCHPHHHHQQPYHLDIPYGSHMGIYGNLYNMYSGYGALSSLTMEENAGLPDSHQNFLRLKGDHSQNSAHQSPDQPFEPHYENHIFSRSHIDINTGFGSTRPPFSDTNGHVTNSGSVGANGNSSPLSFLGGSVPNHLLQPRSSSEQCSYLSGHQMSSALACGQGHNYVRANCGSPTTTGRQNGGSYLHSLSRSESYFVDGEAA